MNSSADRPRPFGSLEAGTIVAASFALFPVANVSNHACDNE